MAAKENKSSTDVDSEISSIVSQILSDILESSADQSEASASYSRSVNESTPRVFSQPRSSKVQQEGDGASINPTPSTNSEHKIIEEETHSNVPYQTCTVKDMLNEILDCTIIRKPSIQLPSTSAGYDRNLPSSPSPPPEYMLDPRMISRQIYNVRRDSSDSTTARVQCTVKDVLSELMDHTVFKKINRQVNIYDYSMPSTSRTRSEHFEQTGKLGAYEIYRAFGAGIVNSANAIHDELYLRKSSLLSIQKILPSYSSVLRMGPPPRNQMNCSSCSFVPRKPPPSYAEVEGIWEDSPSLISSESAVFGPDPTYMICPRCRTAVVTDVQVHRSIVTHLIAFFLCLCMCWPCCLMPYCLRSCNYSHHTCPHCSYYFGMYRPF